MTEFNLGVLSAYATINDAPFNAAYPRLVAKFRALFAESTKSAAGVDKLDVSLAAVADSSAAASAGLSRVGTSTTRAGAAQARAAAQAKVFADAQARVNATMAQYVGASARVQAAALRVAAAEDRLNAVMASETATTRQLAGAQAGLISAQRSLAAAQDAGAASGGRFAASQARVAKTGKSLTHTLGLPLAAIGILSVKAATDFNASMTRIQTQAGASAKDVQVLTHDVLAMKGAQQGPNELAGALYHLKSVGLDNAGAMKGLRAGSDLAAVGNANLEETVNALAGAWRTGIKGAKDFHQAAATVNAVIGAGNMTLEDFTSALGTGILPSAKTFGLTLKDVGSALALFTDEGVPADAAATRLRMTFSLLGAPSKAAEKQLASIGLTGLKLANDMRKPNGLITAIGDLKAHLEDPKFKLSLSEQAQLLSHAFGGGRSSSAILSLINNFDVLKQKQDQVTASLGKYDAAVKAQQATPAAKFHQAVSELEKAGVLLGTQLLPVATQFAHVIAGIASGFNSLSSGQVHFVAQVGIALLVLGPMLSLTSRVARGITVMSGVMGRFGSAAKFAGVALASAGIGFAIGRMTQNASGAAKAVGALTATLTGAAIGFQVGGPLGAAVGGLTGLIGDLGAAFGFGSDGAAAKAAELQGKTDDLTQALLSNQEAVNKTNRAWVGSQIAQGGILGQMGHLGLSYDTVTRAIMGSKSALDEVKHAWTDPAMKHGGPNFADQAILGPKAKAAVQNILDLANAYGRANRQLDKIRADRASTKNLFDASKAAALRNADAVSRLAAGSTTAAGAMRTESGAAGILAGSIASVTRNYLKMVGAELGARMSELQFLDSLHSMNQAIKDSNGSLAAHSVKGRAAQEALVGLATAAKEADNGTQKGNRALLAQITTLRSHAIAAGADKGTVDKLLGSMKLLPSQIRMILNVDTGASMAKLRAIQDQVNRMHGKTLFVGVAGGHDLSQNKQASGGLIRGPGTGTSDSIPAWLSNGEFVVNAAQTAKHRNLLHAINRGAQGFAAGGGAGTKVSTAVGAASSAISAITGQPGSPPIDLSGFTWRAFLAQLHTASDAIAKAVAAGASQKTIAGLRDRLDRLREQGIRVEHKLGAGIAREAASLAHSATTAGTTGSAVAGQLKQLESDLRRAGLPKQFIAGLAKDNTAILNEVKKRNQAAVHLTAANQALADARKAMRGDARSFGGAVTGSFDITSAGQDANGRVTRGGIVAADNQAVTRARAFVAGMKKLIGMKVFPNRYLRTLLGEGPSALPEVQALAGMPRAELLQLAADNRQLTNLGKQIGDLGAGRLDQGAVNRAQRRVDHYQKIENRDQKELIHELRHLAGDIATELRNEHLRWILKGTDLVLAAQGGASKNAKATRGTPPRPGGR